MMKISGVKNFNSGDLPQKSYYKFYSYKMKLICGILFTLFFIAQDVKAQKKPFLKADATKYTQTLKKLTDVMIEDVTGPCAAARYYTYANMVSYEIINQHLQPDNYFSLHTIVSDYPDLSGYKKQDPIDINFASLYGLLRIGEELLPSGYLLETPRNDLLKEAGKQFKLNKQLIDASIAYADTIVKHFARYAARDGYVKTSGYMRYTPFKEPGSWQPTPPGYMEAYEPHWGNLRPFLLEEVNNYKPEPPVPFSAVEGTDFFNLAKEVYDSTNVLTDEQKEIAGFWDCNPFFLIQKGHITFGTKKISPGGHWMGITGIASIQKQLSLAETVRWHTYVSITMADAFISCWKEKYVSNRIRPETFINVAIDRDWRPILQTPPFPEYTSGHSVVSSSVAIVLTKLAGENFSYTDTVEEEFGLPARSFNSFCEAAQEAAISRFYGGIHFKDAIYNGVAQGEKIGNFMAEKLDLNKSKSIPYLY
ncbi:hypothetical protein BH23BAC1_BH23BAC1_41670 [soil metagenome]